MNFMKGTLIFNHPKQKWEIHYNNEIGTTYVDVQEDLIERYNHLGIHLKDGQEIEFHIQEVENFPYRWGIPKMGYDRGIINESSGKEIITFIWFEIEVVGSHYVQTHKIKSMSYSKSDGAWDFFNILKNRSRDYIAHFPISCTSIISMEKVEEECEVNLYYKS